MFKIMLFRMWAAGAVCFFAAWGRSGSLEAGSDFSVNLIVGLIAVMVICDLFIVNPVIRMASGKRAFFDTDSGRAKKPGMIFFGGPLRVIKVAALILLIVQTYYFLNIFFITIFKMDAQSVPVPLEPVLFGILYGLYFMLFDTIKNYITGKLTIFAKEKV